MSERLEKMLEAVGHSLMKTEAGENDDWALEDMFCNGYICESCSGEWCVHCHRGIDELDIAPCIDITQED